MLFAEADAGTPTPIVVAFCAAAAGVFALMGWVIKHLLTTTIPGITGSNERTIGKIVDGDEQARKATRETFTLSLDGTRKTFSESVERIMESNERRQEMILQHCESQACRERDAAERYYGDLVKRLEQSEANRVAESKEFRHAFKDLTHELGLHRALMEVVCGVKKPGPRGQGEPSGRQEGPEPGRA